MAETYDVAVSCAAVPVAGDRPVVFHGINKSGSLAMARVMSDAYWAAGREDQFYSSYLGKPDSTEALLELIEQSTGHAFFVGHDLWPVARARDPMWVTQVRHPLPRALSVHGWLKGRWLREHGDAEGFPSLHDWILRTPGGRGQTQMIQIAIGWVEDRRAQSVKLTAREMRDLALERLEHEFAWFGIAELFEESIFALAHLCGLPSVPPWQRDTRNRWRDAIADTDPETVSLIEETYAEEIAFYDAAVALFRRRLADCDFGPSFGAYKAQCATEYGERLVS